MSDPKDPVNGPVAGSATSGKEEKENPVRDLIRRAARIPSLPKDVHAWTIEHVVKWLGEVFPYSTSLPQYVFRHLLLRNFHDSIFLDTKKDSRRQALLERIYYQLVTLGCAIWVLIKLPF
jgi:hypothetical protein